jgi:hypothetical protein
MGDFLTGVWAMRYAIGFTLVVTAIVLAAEKINDRRH